VFIEESFGFERVSVNEGMMAVDTVVTMEGRVLKAQLLDEHGPGGLHARDRQALLNAVKELRFSPAQARSGRPVAVRTLLLFAHTTITEPWRPLEPPVRAVLRRATPVAAAPVVELPPAPPPQVPEIGGVGSLGVLPSATV